MKILLLLLLFIILSLFRHTAGQRPLYPRSTHHDLSGGMNWISFATTGLKMLYIVMSGILLLGDKSLLV